MLKQTVTSGVVRYNFSMVNNNTAYNDVLVLDRGNVGIGTTSPVGKLNVALPADSNGNVGAWGSNQVVFTRGGTSTSQGIGFSVHDANNTATISSLTPAVTWSVLEYRALAHFFYSTGTNIGLMQDTNANVGIGTTSPLAKLDIHKSDANGTYGRGKDGNLNLENTNTSNTEGGWLSISGYMGNTVSQYQMGAISGGKVSAAGNNNYGGYLSLWTTSGGANGEANSGEYERVRIDDQGRMGIGTTTPTGKLNIQQSSLDTAALFIGRYNAEDSPIIQIGESTSFSGTGAYGEALIASRNRDIVFSTGDFQSLSSVNTAAMIIEKGEGNVGIGTTSPAYPLDVTGEGRFTTNLLVGHYIYHDEDTNTSIRFLVDRIILYAGGVNMIDITEGSTDYIDFANNTARITSGGSFECTGDVIAYTTTSLSDKKQKQNIKKIDSPIEKIKQISGYTFDWKHNQVSSGGVIAQEVEKVLPEIVKQKSIMDSEPHKTVEYNGLIGLLIETVKEQQKQIDELKERLDGITN